MTPCIACTLLVASPLGGAQPGESYLAVALELDSKLQEARRLLAAGCDLAAAAYAVGYESASLFSREDARMFGVRPPRDADVDARRAA